LTFFTFFLAFTAAFLTFSPAFTSAFSTFSAAGSGMYRFWTMRKQRIGDPWPSAFLHHF